MGFQMSLLSRTTSKRIWIFLVLAWAVLRTIIVKDFFSSYGIHPGLYLLIDLISSVPYAHYSANLVISYLDNEWNASVKNFLFTSFFFYIPDIYIFTAAKRIPHQLLIAFLLSVIFFSIIAGVGIIKKIRGARQ